MIQILACLNDQHDPLVVLAAAALCVTAALACALSLRGPARIRPVIAALLIGAGAWSTHFVALLAYDPGMPLGFAVAPTLLSVGIALGGSLAGFAAWSSATRHPWCRPAGGALLGAALAAMHYTGMGAVRLPGHLTFALGHVAASLALAAGIGALALHVLRRDASISRRLAGAALLASAIVSLHFTGMGGVLVWPDPEVSVPTAALPRAQLLLLVTVITAVTLLAALLVLAIETRMDLAARAAEAGRLRSLADAAFEALALLDSAGIVADASRASWLLARQPHRLPLQRPPRERDGGGRHGHPRGRHPGRAPAPHDRDGRRHAHGHRPARPPRKDRFREPDGAAGASRHADRPGEPHPPAPAH